MSDSAILLPSPLTDPMERPALRLSSIMRPVPDSPSHDRRKASPSLAQLALPTNTVTSGSITYCLLSAGPTASSPGAIAAGSIGSALLVRTVPARYCFFHARDSALTLMAFTTILKRIDSSAPCRLTNQSRRKPFLSCYHTELIAFVLGRVNSSPNLSMP